MEALYLPRLTGRQKKAMKKYMENAKKDSLEILLEDLQTDMTEEDYDSYLAAEQEHDQS